MADSEPDSDAAARRDLRRHRAVATGLLAAMGGLTVGTYAMPPGYAADVLQAAAKAGFVGGVADWFAVTALFRRPLGLPIPHTAIVPRQKERLGRALGRFVANSVLGPDDVARVLDGVDAAAVLRGFLRDPDAVRPAAQALASIAPRLLRAMDDGRAGRLLARLIPRLLGGPAAGLTIARALNGLVEGGKHQEAFGFVLANLRDALSSREDALRAAIADRVREQGGRLVGWALGASVARRVLAQVHAELDKMSPDGSELRAAFDEWVRREIARLQSDPDRAAQLGAALRAAAAHPSVRAWAADILARIRRAAEADAAKPDGRIAAAAAGALAELGQALETDPDARARVRAATRAISTSLLPTARERLEDAIARIVGGWDAATVAERLELRIGRDLQYVRMNGTLVGFLVGGALYALLRAVFGSVAS